MDLMFYSKSKCEQKVCLMHMQNHVVWPECGINISKKNIESSIIICT